MDLSEEAQELKDLLATKGWDLVSVYADVPLKEPTQWTHRCFELVIRGAEFGPHDFPGRPADQYDPRTWK